MRNAVVALSLVVMGILSGCFLLAPPVEFANPADPFLSYGYDGPLSLNYYPNDEGVPFARSMDATGDGRLLAFGSVLSNRLYTQTVPGGEITGYDVADAVELKVDLEIEFTLDEAGILAVVDEFILRLALDDGTTDEFEPFSGDPREIGILAIVADPPTSRYYVIYEELGTIGDVNGLAVLDSDLSVVADYPDIVGLRSYQSGSRAGVAVTDTYVAANTETYGLVLIDKTTGTPERQIYHSGGSYFGVAWSELTAPDGWDYGALATTAAGDLATIGFGASSSPVIVLDPDLASPLLAEHGTHGTGPGELANAPDLPIAADGLGRIYVTERSANFVRDVVAGSDVTVWPEPAEDALAEPSAIASSPDGTLYFLDRLRRHIVRTDPDGTRAAVVPPGTLGNPSMVLAASTAGVVTWSDSTDVRLLSPAGSLLDQWNPPGPDSPFDIALLSDGTVVVADLDDTASQVELFELAPGGVVGPAIPVQFPAAVVPQPDGSVALAADDEGTLVLAVRTVEENVVAGRVNRATGVFTLLADVFALVPEILDWDRRDLIVSSVAARAGHVWLVVPNTGAAYRFDLESGEVRGTLGVSDDPESQGVWRSGRAANLGGWADVDIALGPNGTVITADAYRVRIDRYLVQ